MNNPIPTRSEALDELQRLADTADAEHRSLDAEESKRADELVALVERYNEIAKAAKDPSRIEAGAPFPTRDLSRSNKPIDRGLTYWKRRDPWAEPITATADPADMAARAMTAVERSSFGADSRREFVTKQIERTLEEQRDPTGALARSVVALSSDDYTSAFAKLATDPLGAAKLTDGEREAVRQASVIDRGFQNTSDGAGGYLSAPLSLDPAWRFASDSAMNPIGALASVRVISGTDTYRIPYTDGATAYFGAELGVTTAGDATYSVSDIMAHRLTVHFTSSLEFQDDVARFEADFTRLINDATDQEEADKFHMGTGTNQPWGLVRRLDANTDVEVVNTTDGQFSLTDVFKVRKALGARFRPNASWLATIGVIDTIRQFVMAQNSGEALWSSLGPDVPERLLGAPVYEATTTTGGLVDYGSTGTTGASNIMLYGDVAAAYTVVRRTPTRILPPQLAINSSGVPVGQMLWLAYARVGGDAVVQTQPGCCRTRSDDGSSGGRHPPPPPR